MTKNPEYYDAFIEIKFLFRATIPNPISNKLVDDPSLLAKMEDFINNTWAESAFFMLIEGERSVFFAMDIESPEQMCNACEALLILGAKVYRDIIMTFDQMKKRAPSINKFLFCC